MKNILKLFAILLISVELIYAQPIEKMVKSGDYDVVLSTNKSLVVGSNEMYIILSKDSVIIDDAKVKIKVFMPEMPGMPYMEYGDKGQFSNGKYKINVNFSMSGTWQYHLKFKTQDGKINKVRGSLNL